MTRAEFANRVAFAIGTGRSGTHFLARVFEAEPAVASSHERNRFNESYDRYCRWYRLPVDEEGFITAKANEIAGDLETKQHSFEASCYLSLSVRPLVDRFDAKFILMVRKPDAVVSSHWTKGWYENPFIQGDPNKALGYQPVRPHTYFSRLAPVGGEFERWRELTRIGKLAWFYNALNLAILKQFDSIPAHHKLVVKLEDMSHAKYCELARFCDIEPTLTADRYDVISRQKPGAMGPTRTPDSWDAQEIREFEAEVRPSAERFGYEYRVDAIIAARSRSSPPQPTTAERVQQSIERAREATRLRVRGLIRRLAGEASDED